MRKEFLRDVIAGSAGVLVVLAVIGLPKDHAAPTQHVPVQWQGTRLPVHLLPYYSRVPRLGVAPPLPARPSP